MKPAWRYVEGGRVRHRLRQATDRQAACGFDPWMSLWRGNGPLIERMECARLPDCGNCVREANR